MSKAEATLKESLRYTGRDGTSKYRIFNVQTAPHHPKKIVRNHFSLTFLFLKPSREQAPSSSSRFFARAARFPDAALFPLSR